MTIVQKYFSNLCILYVTTRGTESFSYAFASYYPCTTLYSNTACYAISCLQVEAAKDQSTKYYDDERIAWGQWMVARMYKVPDHRWQAFQDESYLLLCRYTREQAQQSPTSVTAAFADTVGHNHGP